MKGPSSGLMTVKSLDDFNVWPVKHRHWTFEVVEDESHDVWISTRDIRAFYSRLPNDGVLKTSYQRTSLYAKEVRTLYLSERSMRMELAKSKAYSEHTDVLKFLDWFHRNVSQVATKKRSIKKLDVHNEQRDVEALKVHARPVPTALVPSHLEASTLPMEAGERCAVTRDEGMPPKVFRASALQARTTWSEWAQERIAQAWLYTLSFFKGERSIFLTFGFCFLLATLPYYLEELLLPESLDFSRSYMRAYWSMAAMVPIAVITATAIAIALTRSALASFKKPAGILWGGSFYLLTIGLAPLTVSNFWNYAVLDSWWSLVTGKVTPAEVYADPHLGRIVIRGEFKWGTADALQSVLDRNPKLTLIEIDSPGGLVIEGLRMAQMIEDHKMDTVALELCQSACTLLLASGTERYLGPEAEIGFHRSGKRYGPISLGWSSTDHKMAELWQRRGVDPAFIQKALKPSIRELWIPIHGEMFTAGYATLRWAERKSGS